MKTRPVNLTNGERLMVSEIINSVLNSSDSLSDNGRCWVISKIPDQVLSVELLMSVQRKFAPVVPVYVPAGQGASELTSVEGE